ncbi:hypothetical protein C8R46DRAFT_883310 [Mycena filopes]|nr:hypothetical protein C8R46DRAFT_883310 [Mycena filopes]
MKESIFQHDPFLRYPWADSAFTAAEFFLGDQESPPRIDDLDAIWGWRALTALGDYDPHWGGELILWEEKKVIKFPPGATFLFPSSMTRYSFTQIRAGESRFEFNQYAQAGLFRYAENDFLSEANFEAISWQKDRRERERAKNARMATALGAYGSLKELVLRELSVEL